jgi:hypothetical protein
MIGYAHNTIISSLSREDLPFCPDSSNGMFRLRSERFVASRKWEVRRGGGGLVAHFNLRQKDVETFGFWQVGIQGHA